MTEDCNFGGIELSPLAEFTRQLNIMTARYRIGDGTGAASVNPATSCVQDSNQALYVTIRRIEAAVASNPQIQDWLRHHPQDAQTQRFQKLVKLGRSLQRQLTPLGIIRSDWENNAQYLAGTRPPDNLITTISAGITSWRTLLPRRAQDEIASLFLRNGAKLSIIRTNQIGGFDPNIEPLAPTAFFGHRKG